VPAALDTGTTSYPLWCVDRASVARLAAEGDILSARGLPGTALIFGDRMVHGSPPNMSPWHRRIYSLILNPVANALTKQTRSEHQHHRDLTPVTPLADDCLLEAVG
jgi:ectoine hydroxylase